MQFSCSKGHEFGVHSKCWDSFLKKTKRNNPRMKNPPCLVHRCAGNVEKAHIDRRPKCSQYKREACKVPQISRTLPTEICMEVENMEKKTRNEDDGHLSNTCSHLKENGADCTRDVYALGVCKLHFQEKRRQLEFMEHYEKQTSESKLEGTLDTFTTKRQNRNEDPLSTAISSNFGSVHVIEAETKTDNNSIVTPTQSNISLIDKFYSQEQKTGTTEDGISDDSSEQAFSLTQKQQDNKIACKTVSFVRTPKCFCCEDFAETLFQLNCGHQFCTNCTFNIKMYDVKSTYASAVQKRIECGECKCISCDVNKVRAKRLPVFKQITFA